MSDRSMSDQRPVAIVFRFSRAANGAIAVAEYAGAARGEFEDLSSAMRFASEEAGKRGLKADMRFDASLAMIRAAG